MTTKLVSRPLVVALALAAAAAPARAEDPPTGPDLAEWNAFQDTLERYTDRMMEFQSDAREQVDAQESEEKAKITGMYGAAMQRVDQNEAGLRRVTIARVEGFLQKYPETRYTPDMLYRLADLYFEETEVAFDSQNEEYARLEAQLEKNPSMVLPPPPLKDYSRSIALYRRIVDKYPKYEFVPDTLYALGFCLNVQNSQQYDADAARDVFLKLAAAAPGTPFANEANMQLGEYYFDLPGPRTNPAANIPTAIHYYEAVLADGPTGRNYDRAIYKLGWSHYKLNDYDRALAYLVQLLDYSQDQFDRTGKQANTRPEAVEYLAISYADIADRQGKRAVDVAMQHMQKVGPRAWQHDVMERLADILWVQAKWEASIDAYEFMQKQWPTDPMNPVYEQDIALIWGGSGLNAESPPQKRPPIPFPDQGKSAKAFEKIVKDYVEGTPWYAANRENSDAIATARGFVEASLGNVAEAHLADAQETHDLATYRLAAGEFKEFLDTFPLSEKYDEYEWYRAVALFESNQFADAEKQYTQIIKNPRSKYRDQARYQLLKAREELLVAKYGQKEALPPNATIEKTVTTPFGKQITQYALSDEHKAYIAACDDLVDRDLSDPEMAKAVDEIRSALVYIPAQIYYNHGNYEEARRRLMLVRQRFPESSLALEASKTFLNTYIQEGDLQNIRKYTEYFQKNPVGPESERLAANGIFAKQQEQVDFVLAQKKSEAGDFAGAAQGFLDFMRDYPTSDYAKDAHFNAANNFDKLGKADEANRLFEQYIDKYPSDERSKNLYFRIAQNYSSTLDLNKALTYYDQLVKRFPDAESAPDAAFNAAFLRVGIGDHVNAAKNFEAYATRYPDKSDAEPAFWRAGEQWQLVGENDALAFYQRYLKTYPNGDPNHTIDALHSIAQIYEKRGNARQAAPYWAQIQQVYSSASPASLTARSRSLAAEGALNDLLAKYETFKVVKWTTNEQKNVDILKNQKPGELKALITQSRQMITTYQDYDTAAAAIYVEGMGLFAYADMAYNCPPPKGLSEDELAQYQDLVAQQLQIPFEDQGKARLIASLEKAKSEKRWSEWNAKAASELHKRYPKEFPSEERQESRATSSAVDLPFAGPTGAAAAPATPAPAAPAPAAPAPATPAPGTPDPNTPPAPATPPGGN